MPSDIPERPWEVVGADLFEWNQHQYLLIVDYLSRYIEIAKLSSATSAAVIAHLKSIFARHGIPSTVRTDNGPQFSSDLFGQFAKAWSFRHITSSPRFPQSNGEAERAVRTIKHMLKKESDPYLALMTYRATPLSNGHSPAELLMRRRLRTILPVVLSSLRPRWTYLQQLRQKEQDSKRRQQRNFNRRHRAHHLPGLNTGDHVWVSDTKERGTVLRTAHTPRSYLVKTPSGVLHRNRGHLVNTPVGPGEPDQINLYVTGLVYWKKKVLKFHVEGVVRSCEVRVISVVILRLKGKNITGLEYYIEEKEERVQSRVYSKTLKS